MKRLPLLVKSPLPALRSTRRGATLSEALVALLIMAIGVVSLASLFPIAVLKTAKANQLTNATNIRYNAESMIEIYPWIKKDPNPAIGASGRPFGDAVTVPFLFDPQALTPGRPAPMPSTVGFLPRFGGGFNLSTAAADAICAGPDNWTLIHENSVTSSTAYQLTLNDLDTVSSLQWPGANQMRAQIFYNGGKSSLTRMVTQATNGSNVLKFTEDINGNSTFDSGEDQNGNLLLDTHALPSGITFETVRLESRERRYTWLLTVRPNSGSPEVEVVVYFGRTFSPEDEVVYGTAPNGIPITNSVASSQANLIEGSRTFTISWPSGTDAPNLKRGSWVLDAQGGYWYRIENYTPTENATSSTVTLSANIQQESHLVVFPRGVVDVFPL